MDVATPQLFSLGEAASKLGQPIHRIDYLIRSGAVTPSFRVGGRRVLTALDVERLRLALTRRTTGQEGAVP